LLMPRRADQCQGTPGKQREQFLVRDHAHNLELIFEISQAWPRVGGT
jgi:hypothetical protein